MNMGIPQSGIMGKGWLYTYSVGPNNIETELQIPGEYKTSKDVHSPSDKWVFTIVNETLFNRNFDK